MWLALAVVAALLALSAWSSWDTRRKLLARLRREWRRPRSERADLEAIADFFLCQDADGALDDRSWNDLLFDDVFACLDRTVSTIGQQILYYRLRFADVPRSLGAFDALVVRFSGDASAREHAQIALAGLRHSSGHYLHRLARPGTLVRPWWHVVFPIWTASLAAMLALGFVWHGLFLLAIAGFIVNVVIRIVMGHRVGGEAIWFRQVGPLISAAHALSRYDELATAPITGSMNADLTAVRRLGAIARWVSRGGDSGPPADPVGAIIEYINIQFLIDINALYFASRELRSRAPHLLRLIEAVGEIDAAIAVASFRESAGAWVRPNFTAASAAAVMSELRHPLVDDAVPNSVEIAPPHGVLITGSNMSGKSTFLRTIGVNVALAQTINTCLATRYDAPVYRVLTCIGAADELTEGKSYYLVEVESVLARVRASAAPEPHLFIFDELFRGTNAVERIAAGEAVLRALLEGQKRHVVLVATHDGELVDLLRDVYAVCHLRDSIGPSGLTFDYKVTPGPATSRNAIALLKLNGAPDSLVNGALARAAELDRFRGV
jgi:hypothetical protein